MRDDGRAGNLYPRVNPHALRRLYCNADAARQELSEDAEGKQVVIGHSEMLACALKTFSAPCSDLSELCSSGATLTVRRHKATAATRLLLNRASGVGVLRYQSGWSALISVLTILQSLLAAGLFASKSYQCRCTSCHRSMRSEKRSAD